MSPESLQSRAGIRCGSSVCWGEIRRCPASWILPQCAEVPCRMPRSTQGLGGHALVADWAPECRHPLISREGGCVTAGRAGVAALAQYAPRYGVELGEPSGPDWLRVDRILEPDGPELTELL